MSQEPRRGRRPAPAAFARVARRAGFTHAPAEALERRLLMAVFTVSTTADSGPGSLRQAILSANDAGGTETDEIRFNIPGPGVHTIAPGSALPTVAGPTIIDGRTQPGYAGVPLVEVSGAGAGPAADGLVFTNTTGTGTVYALVINRFSRHGVVMDGQSQQRIFASYVGTTADGTAAAGNGGAGVVVSRVGSVGGAPIGTAGSLGNVISGNGGPGIIFRSVNVSGASITGNYIGTDATGSFAIGNGREGILVESGSNTFVSNNVISGNAASGVRVTGAANGIGLSNNFIGTDAAGQRALPNGASPLMAYRDGVTVEAQGSVSIGSGPRGDIGGSRNVISGNAGNGISVRGAVTTGTSISPSIVNNFIGTDATGNVALGNGGDGIHLYTPQMTARIAGNLISANGGDGIDVESARAVDRTLNIVGNYVGTNVTGTAPLGNAGDGIALLGAVRVVVGGVEPSPIRLPSDVGPIRVGGNGGNVISANGGAGVAVRSWVPVANEVLVPADVAVVGNVIGSDVLGTSDLGNEGDGVLALMTAGAPVRVHGNLVSGNGGSGVFFEGAGGNSGSSPPPIGGNYIGTNAAGTAPLPNDGNGVVLRRTQGIAVGGFGAVLREPFVSPRGTTRNVISGNRGHGVLIDGEPGDLISLHRGNRVFNNYVGTDAGGTVAIGNGGSGVYIASGSHMIGGGGGSSNVIAANGGNGITIVGALAVPQGVRPTNGNVIAGNRIGTGAGPISEPTNLGNRGHGVAIFNSVNNSVGGTLPTTANTIAFNGGSGVLVEGGHPTPPNAPGPADGNLILGNSIYSNGRLGIDLSPSFEGVTPNDPLDADTGPNRLQNFPVITQALVQPNTVTVRFTLNSEPWRTFRVEFFAGPQPDSSGHGEGRTFLGSADVTTNGSGNFSGAATLTAPVAAGSAVTATATLTVPPPTGSTTPTFNTSEFSPAVTAVAGAAVTKVAARHMFYNNSAFDGGTTGGNEADDRAIAPDKSALRQGARATFENVSTYARGINGIMVDIANLPWGDLLRPSDFVFRVGTSDGTAGWVPAPEPTGISVRRGMGDRGYDRVTILWEDGAVRNTWLQVTVKATEATGLAAPDVFYFGSLVAETGDKTSAPPEVDVDAADLVGVRRALGTTSPLTGRFDFDRNGRVDALDIAIVRANLGKALQLITPTTTPGAPAEVAGITSMLRGQA